MAKQRNALRAGIFMVVSVALVIFLIIAISGAGRFTQTFKTYPIVFSLADDVAGLRVGDDVRVGGVKVGSVREIEIRKIARQAEDIPAQSEAVVVMVELPEKYPVAVNAVIAVQKGLTGAATINVTDLGDGKLIAAGEYFRGRPDALSAFTRRLGSIDVAQLNTDFVKLGHTADSFTSTGLNATATIQDLHVRLPEMVTWYHDLVNAAIAMLDTIREFLGPSSGDFRTTLANISHLSGDLREKTPDLLDQMRTILRKVDISVTRANNALADIQTAVVNTKDLTGSLRAVIVDNKSKLDAMVGSLKTTTDNLKYASVEIRHSPWRLLYQPKPDEVANLNTYDSVRQFAEGANSLDDAASALRDALNDKNADPEEVKKLMAHLDESFAKFQEIQDKLWKDIKP